MCAAEDSAWLNQQDNPFCACLHASQLPATAVKCTMAAWFQVHSHSHQHPAAMRQLETHLQDNTLQQRLHPATPNRIRVGHRGIACQAAYSAPCTTEKHGATPTKPKLRATMHLPMLLGPLLQQEPVLLGHPLYSRPPSARFHNFMDDMRLRMRGPSCSPCVLRRLSCTSHPGCDPWLYHAGSPNMPLCQMSGKFTLLTCPIPPVRAAQSRPLWACSALGSICHQLRGPLCGLWHLQLVQTRHHLRLDNPVPGLQLLHHLIAVRDIPKHAKGPLVKG